MYKTTFAELKTRAKDVLKSNYWYSFGVCIIGFTYHITRNFGCYGD